MPIPKMIGLCVEPQHLQKLHLVQFQFLLLPDMVVVDLQLEAQENDRIVCGTSTSPEAALLLLVRIQFLLLPDMVVVDLGATSHTNLVQLQAQNPVSIC
ncbi:hypothetical protein P8452_42988 [Trifolium repens]|nr:hypothetical protein P8452_42988 [Trifolium repens]